MPSEIASCPETESTRTFGRKLGDTRSGPRSRSVSCCSRIPWTPPIADPKMIPTRDGSYPFRPASASASPPAATPRRTFRSSFLASFGATTCVPPRLLAADHVERQLCERAQDPARLLHDRRRRAVCGETRLHPLRVPLRLDLVVLELPDDVRVVRRRDHPVEHPQDVLLHRMRLVDVLDQLLVHGRHRSSSDTGHL